MQGVKALQGVVGTILLAGLLSSAIAHPDPLTSSQQLGARRGGGPCADAGHISGCCSPMLTNNGCAGRGEPRCFCDLNCHRYGDCCSDIAVIGCLPPPRTCSSAGFTRGCCRVNNASNCFVPAGECFCDETCFMHGDCCEDVERIGCVPTLCATANLSNGNCFVAGGACYCDHPRCLRTSDCCPDANTTTCSFTSTINTRPAIQRQSHGSRPKVLSHRVQQQLKAMKKRPTLSGKTITNSEYIEQRARLIAQLENAEATIEELRARVVSNPTTGPSVVRESSKDSRSMYPQSDVKTEEASPLAQFVAKLRSSLARQRAAKTQDTGSQQPGSSVDHWHVETMEGPSSLSSVRDQGDILQRLADELAALERKAK